MRPTEQIYSSYTPEDFKVWNILFNRQMDNLQGHAAAEYLQAVNTVNFTAGKIPDFKETDQLLKPLTGWSIQVVPNLCPDKEFFEYLSVKKFTATCWLRTMQQLDYLEEPDMFHDVFGHIPLLSNPAYANFFKGISQIALDFGETPQAVHLLSRVYWYTIEFGLMHQHNGLKIYGAGIISSSGETKHALQPHCPVYNFDVETILDTPYRTDTIQEKYFAIQGFDELYQSLPQIRQGLAKRTGAMGAM